jgi:hypothetical protein
MEGDAMDGTRHSCRFTVRLAEPFGRIQAFPTSAVEAA